MKSLVRAQLSLNPMAEIFLALRSYLSTTGKNNDPIVDAITALAAHAPWLPAT